MNNNVTIVDSYSSFESFIEGDLPELKRVLKEDSGLQLNIAKTSILPKETTQQVVFDVAHSIIDDSLELILVMTYPCSPSVLKVSLSLTCLIEFNRHGKFSQNSYTVKYARAKGFPHKIQTLWCHRPRLQSVLLNVAHRYASFLI